MTQQVLRLAEKINDQYLTCKICLVCEGRQTFLVIPLLIDLSRLS